MPGRDVSPLGPVTWQEIFSAELAKAPLPSPGRIRVTMTISFFWERVRSMVDVVEADVAWKAPRRPCRHSETWDLDGNRGSTAG